jgi:hypothetical protein
MHLTSGCRAYQLAHGRHSSELRPRIRQRSNSDTTVAVDAAEQQPTVHPLDLFILSHGEKGCLTDVVARYPWKSLDELCQPGHANLWPHGPPEVFLNAWRPKAPSAADVLEACLDVFETGQAFSPYELYPGKRGKLNRGESC